MNEDFYERFDTGQTVAGHASVCSSNCAGKYFPAFLQSGRYPSCGQYPGDDFAGGCRRDCIDQHAVYRISVGTCQWVFHSGGKRVWSRKPERCTSAQCRKSDSWVCDCTGFYGGLRDLPAAALTYFECSGRVDGGSDRLYPGHFAGTRGDSGL